MSDELHIHSFADLKGDLTDKKLIVYSREVADWLTSHVSAMDTSMTTNDPQAGYDRSVPREPMYSLEKMCGMVRYIESLPEVLFRSTRSLETAEHTMRFYEALISSGELIRRDELTKYLKEERKWSKEMADDTEEDEESACVYEGRATAFKAVLDHINTKKA